LRPGGFSGSVRSCIRCATSGSWSPRRQPMLQSYAPMPDRQSLPQPCHGFLCSATSLRWDPESAEHADGSPPRAPSSRLRFSGPVWADQLSILSDGKQLRSRMKDLPLAASIASAAPAGSAGISPEPGENRNRHVPATNERGWLCRDRLVQRQPSDCGRPRSKKSARLGLAHRPLMTASWRTRRSSPPKFPRIWARTPKENDPVSVVDVSQIAGSVLIPR